MKYVIYIGVFFMPDKNAAAHRAKAFAKMISACGYKPVIVGMKNELCEEVIINTYEELDEAFVYSMKYPKSTREWIRALESIKGFEQVVTELGESNIKAVIAMDYFSIALWKMMRYCKKHSIKFIVDTVDWFEKSNYSFPKNIIKDIDTKVRMSFLHKKSSNMITISKFLYDYYQPYVEKIVQIPGVMVSAEGREIVLSDYKKDDVLSLAFVGSPGNKCEKEKIDWLIKIVCKINGDKKRVVFHIAGISKETLKVNRPELFEFENIESSVIFYGKITHDECIKLIRKADFSVIIRENTLLSIAGFPTKLGESFTCGTPVFVTPTSNISEYIPRTHGLIADSCNYESVEKKLYELVQMSENDIERMHEAVGKNNPLECSNFFEIMEEILEY